MIKKTKYLIYGILILLVASALVYGIFKIVNEHQIRESPPKYQYYFIRVGLNEDNSIKINSIKIINSPWKVGIFSMNEGKYSMKISSSKDKSLFETNFDIPQYASLEQNPDGTGGGLVKIQNPEALIKMPFSAGAAKLKISEKEKIPDKSGAFRENVLIEENLKDYLVS